MKNKDNRTIIIALMLFAVLIVSGCLSNDPIENPRKLIVRIGDSDQVWSCHWNYAKNPCGIALSDCVNNLGLNKPRGEGIGFECATNVKILGWYNETK